MSVEDKVGKWINARSCLDIDCHDGGMGGKKGCDVCTDEIKKECKWRVDSRTESGAVMGGGHNDWPACQLVRRQAAQKEWMDDSVGQNVCLPGSQDLLDLAGPQFPDLNLRCLRRASQEPVNWGICT